MRVILLTKDNRHYVLSSPAYANVVGEMRGHLATGGEVLVPADNYAAQEIYEDAQIEIFRVRHRQVEEECAAAREGASS